MAFYFNTITGEFPIYKEDLYNRYPEYNVYQPLPEGIVEYEVPELPEITNLEQRVVDTVKNVNGVWKLTWKIIDLTVYDFDYDSGEWYIKNPIYLIKENNGTATPSS